MNGLLGQLLGGNRSAAPRSVPYRDYVQVIDGDGAYNTVAELLALIGAAAFTDFRLIWEKTIPAQLRYRWGFGSAGLPRNQGYMWFASLDITTAFDVGVLRLLEATAQERRSWLVANIPDQALHTTDFTSLVTATPTNQNEMIALPEKIEFPKVGEDSLLQLKYRLDVASTDNDAVGFMIPVTVYDVM